MWPINTFSAEIENYDPDYTWTPSLVGGLPVGATAEITESAGLHFVTVSGLADGESATVDVETEAPGDVTASAQLISAALEEALTPTFGVVTPTDGGFTVPITNYDGDYDWDLSESAGSATIDTSGTPTLVVTGLSVGQTSVVTVTTIQDGYQNGAAEATGTSLQAAFRRMSSLLRR